MDQTYFQREDIKDKLKEAKCLPMKCKETFWRPIPSFEATYLSTHPVPEVKKDSDDFTIGFFLSSKDIKVTEEVELYNLSKFIADFGGYLGLLLGASLITFFDGFIWFLSFAKEKLFGLINSAWYVNVVLCIYSYNTIAQ